MAQCHCCISALCTTPIKLNSESWLECSSCTWRSRRRHRWWWLPNRHFASSLPSGPGPVRPELSLWESRQNTKCFHCSWKGLMLWIQSDNSLKYVTAFEYGEYVMIRKDWWEKKDHTCEGNSKGTMVDAKGQIVRGKWRKTGCSTAKWIKLQRPKGLKKLDTWESGDGKLFPNGPCFYPY